MSNMEQLIFKTSRRIVDGPADEIWISKLTRTMHTDSCYYEEKQETYAYLLYPGRNLTGYYRLLKQFYGEGKN